MIYISLIGLFIVAILFDISFNLRRLNKKIAELIKK